MQKILKIEQGVPEIWGFKWLEMILLRETKKRKKYHCVTPGWWTKIRSKYLGPIKINANVWQPHTNRRGRMESAGIISNKRSNGFAILLTGDMLTCMVISPLRPVGKKMGVFFNDPNFSSPLTRDCEWFISHDQTCLRNASFWHLFWSLESQ